ncbi:DegQ family serine endoprotease [Marivibrio halodurans]|uniref:DegQ family serine endoprotease n=1 Tax=Marivibrio halodurans TaxID=2039722 RepID=A0A8J7S318_9PROT|nr:DegQ family serine endoprotease [Marivibrio halodurans]MBP5857774.1 DegQ family serine endoprotease [Marivibrio halodurans]
MKQTLAALFALLLLAPSAHAPAAHADEVPRSRAQIDLSFAPIVKQVAPAIVNIYAKKTVESRGFSSPLLEDPFFKRFFGDMLKGFGQPRERVENSLGSGVIVSEDGLVVSNHHVIAGADEIRVVLADRREFDAELLISDERTDIAVLKIKDPDPDLTVAELGRSDDLEVGDLVLAIGNPFGVGQTVTSGIVSGLARTSVGITDIQSFIQTDAAINPGNSGGALVALDGKVVGINTAIFSKSGGSHGIGFAVPVDMARTVVSAAIEGRPVRRPWLGFAGRDVDADIAEALGMRAPRGVIVESVSADGPASDAGLEPGDIVTAIDGHRITDAQSLRFRLATKGVGKHAELTFLRDGAEQSADFALIAPPEEPPRDPVAVGGRTPLSGATFVNLSPAVADELGLPTDLEGVMALKVAERSPAASAGFRPGDILRAINDIEIERTATLRRVLDDGPVEWRLEIERDGEILRAALR